MPTKNTNTAATTNTTQYQDKTIVPLYLDDRFGKGALKSVGLNPESIRRFAELAQPGGCVVIRKSNKKTKFGNDQYFLDILPPFQPKAEQTETSDSI